MADYTYSDPIRRLHPKGASTTVLPDGRRVRCYAGWHIRQYDPEDKKRRWIWAGETKGAAERFLRGRIKADVLGANAVQAVEFEQAFKDWLSVKTCRQITADAYKSDLDGVYSHAFGSRRVRDITAWDVERFMKRLHDEKLAPRTIAKHLICLRSFFRWAIRRRFAAANPCEGLKAPKVARVREPFALSPEEARALLQACGKGKILKLKDGRRKPWRQSFPSPRYLQLAVAIGLYTGLRRRNIFGLRWSQVDLGARRISIPGEEMKKGNAHEAPIHPELLRLLKGALQARRKGKKVRLDEVVVGDRVQDPRKAIRAACRRAEVREAGWHTLRHTFATMMARRVPFTTLQSLLGHLPKDVTSLYDHPPWEERLRAVDSLPAILGKDPTAADRKAEPAEGARHG